MALAVRPVKPSVGFNVPELEPVVGGEVSLATITLLLPNRLEARGCKAITNHVPIRKTCILQRGCPRNIVQNSISGYLSGDVGLGGMKLKNYAGGYDVEIESHKYGRLCMDR